jgi:hypothetical protein
MPDDDEARRKAERDRESLEEWLRANRAETARRDLSDAAPQTDRGTATATQLEALDRAAHTRPFHEQMPLFSAADEKRLAERDRDYAELYPTPEAWARSFPELAAPDNPQQRAQYDDFAAMYPRTGQAKEQGNVTPEQKANVDKALADIQISDKIGGPGEVSARPQPNEPTPIEKAKDVGQALHKSGVEMDK